MKKKPSRAELTELLKSELMYYFWSKCEHEVTIAASPSCVRSEQLEQMIDEREKYFRDYGRYPYVCHVHLESSLKIDVYDQVLLNWDAFVDYVYSKI